MSRAVCFEGGCTRVEKEAMSSTTDRKAELERKKAKLQALREEKDRRRREKEQKDAEEAMQRAVNTSSLDSRRDIDEMLSSLGVAPVKDVLSSFSSMTSLTPPQTASPDVSLPHTDKSSQSGQTAPKKNVQLQVVSVQATDIPPKENVTYAKQTQTTASGGPELRDVLTFDDGGVGGARQGDDEDSTFHGKLPPGILPHGLPTVKEVQPAVTEAPADAKKPEEEKEKKAQEWASQTGKIPHCYRTRCKITDSAVAFCPMSESSGGPLSLHPPINPISFNSRSPIPSPD
ncbi:Cytoplasmic dynein 1 intermediate chain [Eumeta japonica]|uniref:Cytoplasmic dynein 1 intermediate chain n=1 Tax=Eumeta variegata TaxID=151549 RepID=A0A4C1T7R4_EUMVA|nr:Cytoplasmic dynein 1 intermediate chain [Eumeta japonica]